MLGAVRAPGRGDDGARLTDIGKRIARLPIDPRFARMLVEADRTDVLDLVTSLYLRTATPTLTASGALACVPAPSPRAASTSMSIASG